MSVDCLHWQQHGNGGICTAFGKVSRGVCLACKWRGQPLADIPKPEKTFRTVWRNKDRSCAECKPFRVG